MTNKPEEMESVKVWTSKEIVSSWHNWDGDSDMFKDLLNKTFISTDDVKKMLNEIKNTYLNAGGSKNTNSGVLLLKLISNKHRQIQPKEQQDE